MSKKILLNIQQKHTQTVSLEPKDNVRLANLCGPLNENIRQLESASDTTISNNNFDFSVTGAKQKVAKICDLLYTLYQKTHQQKPISQHQIHLDLCSAGFEHVEQKKQNPERFQHIKTKMHVVKALGHNQHNYLNKIQNNDITFGVGPAGTGKTYLAVACAVQALELQKVQRLILVRPAVEAGERLGFLPGDLVQKVDPYLRPLYDALYEIMGVERVNKYIENKAIEVAPIAYMRGRTLNHAFVILDEAQNTTREQMKMFLTRIGFASKAVITGDITQIDLPPQQKSGLVHALALLKNIEGIQQAIFASKDVIRHPIVQKIIDAYDNEKSL